MTVAPDISIRIVTNLDEMHTPAWPWVAKGDRVEVVGRYYYDSPRQQGVDWTHRGTGRSWGIPGYVRVNGTQYDWKKMAGQKKLASHLMSCRVAAQD